MTLAVCAWALLPSNMQAYRATSCRSCSASGGGGGPRPARAAIQCTDAGAGQMRHSTNNGWRRRALVDVRTPRSFWTRLGGSGGGGGGGSYLGACDGSTPSGSRIPLRCQAAPQDDAVGRDSRSGQVTPVVAPPKLSPAAVAPGDVGMLRPKAPEDRQLSPDKLTALQPRRAGTPMTGRPASPLRPSSPNDDQWTTLRTLIDIENPVHPVFDFGRWESHRSPYRHWRHLFSIYGSVVFRVTLFPVMALTGICAIGIAVDRELYSMPELPFVPFLLTSTLMGLLLAYRVNASYDRWWEARKRWAKIVQRTRDLTRQSACWIGDEAISDTIARFTIGWALAVKSFLRRDSNIREDLKEILTEKELEIVLKSSNKPLIMLSKITELVNQAKLSEFKLTQIDNNLTALNDLLGACERILVTPIPLSYTRHTSRFILLYLIFLPLALYPDLGLGTIPATFIMSYVLLGIETIGTLVEEPFRLLPLDLLCVIITCEVLEVMAARQIEPEV